MKKIIKKIKSLFIPAPPKRHLINRDVYYDIYYNRYVYKKGQSNGS
jgi:hypothetical protein